MTDFWKWIFEVWVPSPGFGGVAAVVAAAIAYAGVRRSVQAQREASRKQQWWDRAHWALDLTLSDDSTGRAIGIEVLDALGRSEFASEHEFDLVEAATAPSLEAYRATTDGDIAPGEADLNTYAEEGDQR